MNLRTLSLSLVLSALFLATPARAEFHLFRIAEVYSNADGSVQYIVMREATGANGENFWSGLIFQTTNAAGVVKRFQVPSNLPSSSTASRSVLIATPGFASLGLPTPDFTIPARFIPTEGGTLNYAGGTDRINLPPLPNDGVTAVDHNGNPVAGAPKNFANTTAAMTATPITVVEFYNATLDHYFISSLAGDIDALDTGRIAGWTRTGLTFNVFPSEAASGGSAQAVCRIIIPPPHGDSHFFGRSADECANTLAKFPFMTQETPSAFFIALPAAGVCPAGTVPVYRAFDNRPGDANHRYTTSRAVRDQMETMHWLIEGDGPDSVVMCATTAPAPAASAAASASDPMPMMPPGYGGYGPP